MAAFIMRVFAFVGFLAIATALPNPIATVLPNPIATALPNPETRGSSCAKIPAWMKAAMGKAPAGDKDADRIVGGTNAVGVVPWQVSLRNVESGLDSNFKPYTGR